MISAARSVARHSLGWLVAANLVGLWLSVVLLWPAAGDALAPFTYGRWMPLHLNWQLYGWTSLPVVGVLLTWFAVTTRGTQVALWTWSAALALGGVSWLAGVTSGKLFLDWAGWARPLLPTAMLVLWGVLGHALWRDWYRLSPAARWSRAVLLLVLLPVPQALFWAMGREVYPAVNPDSGGATGAALLGSTLGIITIFLLVPPLLRVPRRAEARGGRWIVALLVASWGVFALLDHGHTSHHALAQSAALALLLAWVPLLALAWRAYAWSAVAQPWVTAALVWWGVLVVSGWVVFLPGVSEATKFTHGLVAHAHLALAGVVTSVNGLLLTTLTGRAAPRGVAAAWHAGCALYIGTMAVLGAFELEHAAELFRGEAWVHALFGGRTLAGLAMTWASVRWLRDFFQP